MMNRLRKERANENDGTDNDEEDLVMELPPGAKVPTRKEKDLVAMQAKNKSGGIASDASRDIRLIKEDISKVTRRLDQQGSLIEINRETVDEVKNEISQINVNIKDLLAIYEFVSQQFNPFAEDQQPTNAEKESHAIDQENTSPPIDLFSPSTTIVEQPTGKARPLLGHLPMDALTNVVILRWTEFLLERVRRDHIPALFDYYAQINWISPEIKVQLLAYIRGEVADITTYEPEQDQGPFHDVNDELVENARGRHLHYKEVDEWRLSADDHLKSYLFIQRILGQAVDKNELNQVELDIRNIKGNLKNYYGL